MLGESGWAITLCWIKAHAGHRGNDLADELAKLGTTQELQGGYIPPMSSKSIKSLVKGSTQSEWNHRWQQEDTLCRQAKMWFPELNPKLTKQLLGQNSDTIGTLANFLQDITS